MFYNEKNVNQIVNYLDLAARHIRGYDGRRASSAKREKLIDDICDEINNFLGRYPVADVRKAVEIWETRLPTQRGEIRAN